MTTTARHTRRSPLRRTAPAAALAAAAGLGVLCGVAHAQPLRPSTADPARRTDGPTFTGRTFGGVPISAAAQRGPITFSAARTVTWNEPGEEGVSEPTQRLLLEGDVQIEVGTFRFSAARAVAWVERIGVLQEDGVTPAFQIAVYFDRVGDPAAEAGLSQHADRLLVTGVLGGEMALQTDTLRAGRPDSAFVREGEGRLARHLRALTGAPAAAELPPTAAGAPTGPRDPIVPGLSRPFEPESPLTRREVPDAEPAPIRRPPEPIFARDGILTIAAPEPTFVTGPDENALIATGGVVLQFIDPRAGQNLQISAERAVIYLDPGSIADLARFQAEDVRGIYLEGDVVATSLSREPGEPQDRQYTIRGPRMYYDLQNDRAVVVDAVFWTYDHRLGMPLYLRADVLRQESQNSFSATRATLSNTSFFDPHLGIGASSITIARRTDSAGEETSYIDARNVTASVLGLPFFYWPRFSGNVENLPLRSVGIEGSSNTGPALRTTWDTFGLLNIEPPRGIDSSLLIDGYFRRGLGLGTETLWNRDGSEGGLFAYSLINDNGTDRLASGARIERDGETRALILGSNRTVLDDRWTLTLEAAHVSDENFIDAFFRPLNRTRREFTNAAFLTRHEGNSLLTVLAKGTFNDFTPLEHELQSRGYTVQKLPEAAYYRFADDLMPDFLPGFITYTSEYRVSSMALNFTEPTAAELGFDTAFRSVRALELAPNQSPGDALRAAGFSESNVLRFDTRHELVLTGEFGPLKVTPFVVGRVTGYDTEFEQFSPDNDEQIRLWGSAGIRASTSITRIDDSVDSRLFDLHRIRHIIEPNVTVWTAGTNVRQTELPTYDERVESLANGSAVRAGINQTWQTMRGGPGQWRSVDVLRLSTDVVFASSDAEDFESPVGRFFDYRPELSLLGNFATVDAAWQATDTLGVIFNMVYDLDLSQPARTIAGGTIQHSGDFSTYAQARYLNARNITLVDFGANYRLTRTYLLNLAVTYDTDEATVQLVSGTLRREIPGLIVGISTRYNNINEEFGLGVVLEPASAAQRSLRLRFADGEVGGLGGRSLFGG